MNVANSTYRWIFYSAVNSVTPQIILNVGFESNSWDISIRQLSYNITSVIFCVPITFWATYFKDMRTPLVATYTIFLAATIGFACISPSWNVGQIVLTVLSGIGTSGPLTLLVACVQFSSPHAYLSTATGLAFSARAIGGAFGSAVINAVINSRFNSKYVYEVSTAAINAGLDPANVEGMLAAMATGSEDTVPVSSIPGANAAIMKAAWDASHWSYAKAYRLGWWSVVPFVVLATVAVACLRGVKELMTEKVEATVETNVPDTEKKIAEE